MAGVRVLASARVWDALEVAVVARPARIKGLRCVKDLGR